jgi:hypothetical protein
MNNTDKITTHNLFAGLSRVDEIPKEDDLTMSRQTTSRH